MMDLGDQKQIAVSAIYDDGNLRVDCFGYITILRIDEQHHKAYVSFQMSAENIKDMAGLTRNYFYGDEDFDEGKVFNMVLEKLSKFRVNRKKVFSNIEIKRA